MTMKKVRVKNLSFKDVTISSEAWYNNPNPVGCTLTKMELDVFVDDVDVGHIIQTDETEIGARSNFQIPINISFPPKELLKSGENLLKVFPNLGDRKVNVRYEGDITVQILGIDHTTDFSYSEEIPLKKGQ